GTSSSVAVMRWFATSMVACPLIGKPDAPVRNSVKRALLGPYPMRNGWSVPTCALNVLKASVMSSPALTASCAVARSPPVPSSTALPEPEEHAAPSKGAPQKYTCLQGKPKALLITSPLCRAGSPDSPVRVATFTKEERPRSTRVTNQKPNCHLTGR